MPVKGTWNVFGVNLKDFGATELFANPTKKPSTFYNPPADPFQRMAPLKSPIPKGGTQGYYSSPSTPGVKYSTLQEAQAGVSGGGDSGGGGGTGNPETNYVWDPVTGGLVKEADLWRRQQEMENRARQEISSAWDTYLGQLQQTEPYIGEQRKAQEDIVNSQRGQAENVIQGQRATSLRDIANTTKNAFQAGNNYLGSLSAGDSSAANQYAFAVNQQSLKQTGDLNNFVNTQLQQVRSEADQKISGIANWFAQAQQTLKQQIAEGHLKKGQDLASLSRGLLDQAMQMTNQVQTNAMNQSNAIQQWAMQNSQNLGQLQQNIAQIPGAMGGINMVGGGVGARRPYYPGANAPTSEDKTDIWGRPIT